MNKGFHSKFKHCIQVLTALYCLLIGPLAAAEEGYDLWLRYHPLQGSYLKSAEKAFRCVYVGDQTATTQAALDELQRGFTGFFGAALPLAQHPKAGCIALIRAEQLGEYPALAKANKVANTEPLQTEGYAIANIKIKKKPLTLITANTPRGLLYGSFALLQHVAAHQPLNTLEYTNAPKVKLRVLNHWDNLDRTVERGYAGESIWDWWHLPDIVSPRYKDYARANASVGINGTVLNNVNAKAESLTPFYLAKAKALADIFRPYGIQVYLSARFSAPVDLGYLTTADPLDPRVQQWWREKAREIYQAIPDFGGFLVKANSEGQPGPQDYGRTHAQGANMLAEALAPHNGVVMWRAFVYSEHNPVDRAKQAYDEFKPLDGKFAPNVLVQVKNGPIDFQPREPFHPLFGATPQTPLLLEFQITKEYLGFATHLAYLGTLYEELLATDTYQKGVGSTVAKVVDGRLHGQALTGIAGVANIGRDRNWSGSIFDQANWFAFARLAWNPEASAEAIAQEWLKLTFTSNPEFVEPALGMMMQSREAVVDYMTPLGLAHLMGTGHHYGPAPWVNDLGRPEWNPAYYHKADKNGIGFDRTAKGSNALAQYTPAAASPYENVNTIDDKFLLWFHRVPWSHKTQTNKSVWHALIKRYDTGVNTVKAMQNTWKTLEKYVDPARYKSIEARLNTQYQEAQWWRDASLAYFQSVNQLPYPEGVKPPPHALEFYKNKTFPHAPGRTR